MNKHDSTIKDFMHDFVGATDEDACLMSIHKGKEHKINIDSNVVPDIISVGVTMDDLAKEVQVGYQRKKGRWYDAVSDDCKAFMAKIADDHISGKPANAAAMARILKQHFGVKISGKSVSVWLEEVDNNEWPK